MIFCTQSAYGEVIAFMISAVMKKHECAIPGAPQSEPTLTALVERFPKLHPPENLALLRVAQVAVEAVPQPLAIEHFARLRWKRSVRVAGAVLSGLFQVSHV